MAEVEQWQTGDLVLAGDGYLWMRADPYAGSPHDEEDDPVLPWLPAPESVHVEGMPGTYEEGFPTRPLTLLVRDRKPANSVAGSRQASELDVAVIRSRLDASSPGPWYRADGAAHLDEHTIFGRSGTGPEYLTHVASVSLGWRREEDAEFIVNARTDIPELCDAYDALTGMIAQIRELLLAGGGEFDDNHGGDARQMAKIADLVGLQVIYEPNEGRPGERLPSRIQVGKPHDAEER